MKSQIGFKRFDPLSPLPTGLQTPTHKNSVKSDTDLSTHTPISFGALKRLANNFDETISLSSDIIQQVKNEMKKEEGKRIRKRRKYNTRKKEYKPVKFIYLIKTKLNLLEESGKLFRDITELVN